MCLETLEIQMFRDIETERETKRRRIPFRDQQVQSEGEAPVEDLSPKVGAVSRPGVFVPLLLPPSFFLFQKFLSPCSQSPVPSP